MALYSTKNGKIYLPAEDADKPNEREILHPETNSEQVLMDAAGTTLKDYIGPQTIMQENKPNFPCFWSKITKTTILDDSGSTQEKEEGKGIDPDGGDEEDEDTETQHNDSEQTNGADQDDGQSEDAHSEIGLDVQSQSSVFSTDAAKQRYAIPTPVVDTTPGPARM